MKAELIILALVLALVALRLGVTRLRSDGRGSTAAAWLGACAVVGALLALARPPGAAPGPEEAVRPLEAPADGWVSSDACAACHPSEHRSWAASYHRRMTQVATPETVLAPFAGERITYGDRSWVFERRGGEFWVELDDLEWNGPPPAPRVWRQIVQTTGSHHQQFYWYATGRSRELGIVHVMYRLGDEPRWMPLDACCVSPPHDFYEAGIGRWSWNCIRCHATDGRPRIRGSHQIDTHVAELGIACEACHGPGAEHVAVNRDPRRRYVHYGADEADPTIVNPARLSHRRASLVCASCHSVNLHRTEADEEAWNERGDSFRPGDPDLGGREIVETGADRFWSDGFVRVSGREYNGLMHTPCFERGEMSCLSCHRMHPRDEPAASLAAWADDQLKPGMRGDEGCTQCHAAYADEEALVAHTHHRPDSTGSRCYECHMPYTTYGLLKGIRSHQLDVPSVAASVATGRPNACNQCHLDRTLAWTARYLDEWYGIDSPPLDDDQRGIAASVLWAVTGEAGQRALQAWAFGWEPARAASGTDWITPYLLVLMNDPYEAVRYVAQTSHRSQEDELASGFDFTQPAEERLSWMLDALRAWIAGAGPVRPGARALLFDDAGRFDVAELDRLLGERDQRDVTLNE